MSGGLPRATGDRLLVGTLVCVGLLSVARVLWEGPDAHATETTAAATDQGAEQTIRNVDVDAVRRRILEGRMSDHEAEHYHPLGAASGKP